MRQILVTGGCGFLGSHLVPRLADDGFHVTVIGRSPPGTPSPRAEFLTANLADPDAARNALSPWRWDAVIHLAGPVTGGSEDLATGISVVTEHVRIALALRHCLPDPWPGRFIHASSMTVYGRPVTTPVREDHQRTPRHLYGLGKMLAEDVLVSDANLDLWVLRFPGLFAHERKSGALYHFARSARAGAPLRLTATEPTCWDVLHVGDAVEALARALGAASRRPGAVNIAYGEPVTLDGIASWFAQHAKMGSEVVNEAGGTHPVFCMDITRATRLFAWPPASLTQRLVEFYDSHRDTGSP